MPTRRPRSYVLPKRERKVKSPRPVPWNRMVAYSLLSVGHVTAPSSLRGFIAVRVKIGSTSTGLALLSLS